MDHAKLLEAYLTKTCSRRTEICDTLSVGEIRVSTSLVKVSHHFISSDTDLVLLQQRVARLILDFDSRQEKERERTMQEIEAIISSRFAWLSRLAPDRASTLLHNLSRQSNVQGM